MAIQVADGFQLKARKPLDARLQFATVADMVAALDADIYDGCFAYVKANKKYYSYDTNNTVDATLGKWRESGGKEEIHEISYSDFQALTQAEKDNGQLYCIPDASLTESMMVVGNRFDKANIYTTTEKMIGSWMGKPLYQKTIDCGNGPVANATKNVNPNISNVDKIVSIKGVAIDENSNALDANNVWINWSTYDIDGYTMTFTSNYSAAGGSTHDVAIRSKSKDLSGLYFYVTIQYTKTTDGQVKVGTPNDYSTDEMIVGTWLNGKPLYQKTISKKLPTTTTDGTFGKDSYTMTDLGIDDEIGIALIPGGFFYNTGGGIYSLPMYVTNANYQTKACFEYDSTNHIYKFVLLNSCTAHSNCDAYITIQYTKAND